MKMWPLPFKSPKHLGFWMLADTAYVLFLSFFLNTIIPLNFSKFIFVHFLAIGVGAMVMFTGLGAGILWIPILTFLDIRPSEAVAISIFTQIAGKGTGSLTYLFNGMVDVKTAAAFAPVGQTISPKSSPPDFFIPHFTPAAKNPFADVILLFAIVIAHSLFTRK